MANVSTALVISSYTVSAGADPTEVPLTTISTNTIINYILAIVSGAPGVDYSSGAQITLGGWGPDQGPPIGSAPNQIQLGGVVPPENSVLLVANAMPFKAIPANSVLKIVVQWNPPSSPILQRASLAVLWNVTM